MKKLSKTKEHPLTTFRKTNEARQAVVKKSLPKAQLGAIVRGLAKAYKAIKPATKVIKSTSRTPGFAENAKFLGKNIGGGGLIGAGIGAGLTKGAELSNKSDNTKVNTNSAGTKTVVHTGANGKKYIKVTDKDGKTFNKVMNKKTGGMVTKYQSRGEVNESSKPVKKYVKPTTVVRPTEVKVNGVMQPIKYAKPTVAIPVRTSKPVRTSNSYVKPPVVTDNPMAGFKVNKPRPVGKYENAVENSYAVKKPSPATSNKINADKIKPSRLESDKIKTIKSKAVASTKPVNKPKLKPTLSTVDKIKLGLLFPTRAIMEMYKKKGGAVKTKK